MPTHTPLRRALPVVAFVILAFAAFGPAAKSAKAAGPTIYVDGKHGSDANTGTSLGSAFKTVKAGIWAIRYGGTLDVVGYNDYVYYETMSGSQWYINGSASSPVVIQAYGYGTSGYVRPIISGAKVVSRPGQGRWTRPNATSYPNVWVTSWTTPIPGYGASVVGFHQERVFADVSQPLVRPPSTSLAALQATPGSQYWDGLHLYVRLGGWGSTPGASLDPNDHTIEVPTYSGLLVSSGSNYVEIMGFRIRHTTMGVGFTGTASHDLVQDVDASYNYTMGFFTASSYNTFRRLTGSRNTIQLIKLDNGADHNVVDSVVGTENMGQGIKLTGAGTQYNTVTNSLFQGGKDVPVNQGGYGGFVQGIDIEQGANHNTITGNRIERNRRGLMLYQMDSSGGQLTGNLIKYNTLTGNDAAVVLWDGKYNTTQGKGAVTFYRNVYVNNTKSVTSEAYTAAKVFDHETYYHTGTLRTQSHSTFYMKSGSITLKNSIILGSAGYHFYAASGAKISVSNTSYWGAGLGTTNSSGVAFGASVKHLDPGFLSTDPVAVSYLTIDSRSPVYRLSSTGGPIGARWR
jgi:parallel beta-helix repeat protein